MIDGFQEMMNIAADPAWRDRIESIGEEMAVPGAEALSADVYRACFGTHAGRAVLADLYNLYVNVSRFVPGEPEGSGYYREGAAQVVFHIAAMIEASAQGESNADQS